MGKQEALRRIEEAAAAGATELNLMNQGLTKLPLELFQLTNLTKLYLSDNLLIKLPQEIFLMTNLTRLDLIWNQLTELPSEIAQLTKLNELWLDNNPLISPPLEIANQGIEAIREYFASSAEGTRTVAEVKVILVGEGASGKTSLTRCLRGERFNPREAMTDGIRIKPLQVETGGRDIKVNLWDFGGQEIMHATHQFFLSRRSLYVLVLDGRRDERPEYWLRYIESFGGDSPVLVVFNKYDTNPSFDLDRPSLQEKYPFIKGFLRTSCNTGQGIETFKASLIKELAEVPLTRNQWPVSWFRAKAELERKKDPRITYEKFETVCLEAGVSGKISRDVLSEFLHDLGIAIHFKDFELDHNYVLDPKWVTGAVYKIINAPSVAERKGVLRLDDLKEILEWREKDEYQYERRDHPYFIKLMQKFELCYVLDDGRVLLPQLFDVPRPSFTFDDEGALRFVLEYKDFLPPAVMPRFIVKRHHEIKDELRWRTGVVLENPLLDATAVIRADNETRRIHIAVSGAQPKVFLALIWLSFREINTGFEGLKVSERVPVPEEPSITVEYETLLNNLEQGIEKFVPEGSKKACSVRELLGTVHPDSQRDGEKMLAAVQADKEEGKLRKISKGLNRYFEGDLALYGIKFNYQNFFEDILNWSKK